MRVLVYPELKPVKGIGYSELHLRRLVKAGLFPNRSAWAATASPGLSMRSTLTLSA